MTNEELDELDGRLRNVHPDKWSVVKTEYLFSEAADAIAALRAENERLRKALRVYSCDCNEGDCSAQGYWDCGKTALAALIGSTGGGGEGN